MDKMKDYKYCNQLFDMALDNGIVTEQDRERFMESEVDELWKEELELGSICNWAHSGFAGEILAQMDIGIGIESVIPSYQRKTSDKTTADRIKEAFEEWINPSRGYTKEEVEFGEMFQGYGIHARSFHAGYMAALKDAGNK